MSRLTDRSCAILNGVCRCVQPWENCRYLTGTLTKEEQVLDVEDQTSTTHVVHEPSDV